MPMSSRICFMHPYRPSLSRVFYMTLTAEQAKSMEKVGRADASAWYPFFALKEHKEHGNEKADVEKGAATEDGVAVVAIEFSMRGVCTLWPHWLQCDTMNHFRLLIMFYSFSIMRRNILGSVTIFGCCLCVNYFCSMIESNKKVKERK
jgi:hypothetical protein